MKTFSVLHREFSIVVTYHCRINCNSPMDVETHFHFQFGLLSFGGLERANLQSLAHHIKSTIVIHARAVILKHIAPAELLLNNITIVKRIAYCVSAYFLWNLWVVWVDIQNINFKCTGFKEGKSFSARNCIPLWEYKGLLGCILGVSIPWQCNWERKPIINLQTINPESSLGYKA